MNMKYVEDNYLEEDAGRCPVVWPVGCIASWRRDEELLERWDGRMASSMVSVLRLSCHRSFAALNPVKRACFIAVVSARTEMRALPNNA